MRWMSSDFQVETVGRQLHGRALRVALAVCTLVRVAPARVADAGQDGRKIVIEVPMFEGGAGLTFFDRCAREYEKLKPHVRVNLYGDPRIADKMRVRILEGDHPELSDATLNYWVLIRNGDILRLDKYLDGPNWEGDSTWRQSFYAGSLDPYTLKGKTYGLPVPYYVYCIWYNKNMFEARGWRPARTWAEFSALCEKIKTAGIAPLAFQGRYDSYAQAIIESAYFHQLGLDAYRAMQDLQPGSFDNPALVKALRLVQHTSLNYFQKGSAGMSHTEAQMQFFLGKTAMIFCGSWLKSEMKGKIPEGFRLRAFNLPIVPGGKGDPSAVYTFMGNFFVFKNSRHPEQAVDFLRFMSSRKMAGLFAQDRDLTVAIRGANRGNVTEDLNDAVAMIEAARTAYGPRRGAGVADMEQHWTDVRSRLLRGEISPEVAAERLEASAAAVRSRLADPDRITFRHVVKPIVLLGLLGGALIYWLASAVRRLRLRRGGSGRRRVSLLRPARRTVVLFVGPALLLYTVFVIVPCVKSFAWSLHRWNGLTDMVYKGLLHFRRLLFESDAFWTALVNNLFLMIVIPVFVLPLSLFFAACMSRGVRGSGVLRNVFLLPNILGVVAASLLWMHMYNPQGGVINGLLVGLGQCLSSVGIESIGGWFESFEGFAWLAPNNLYTALVPMSVWGACGFNVLLFLAAMERIPGSLYEAAELDGASAWKQFRHITLPLIRDVMSIALVFLVIGGMKAFEAIWLLTNQGPTTEQHVIGTRMVQTMFVEFRVGEATAIAVLLFLMVFLGSATTLRLMHRERIEY
jgi:ABC-type sugar transport system permease subunit/ABC-type glycerol-3-phosphate transport system substrate-binding protein